MNKSVLNTSARSRPVALLARLFGPDVYRVDQVSLACQSSPTCLLYISLATAPFIWNAVSLAWLIEFRSEAELQRHVQGA